MSKDPARLTVLLDSERKKAFSQLCASVGTNPSEVVRGLIARYLAEGQAPAPARPAGKRPPSGGS